MVKRQKSKFENFFNVNRYKKRQGASSIMQAHDEIDFEVLKKTIIEGERSSSFQSYMIKDLDEHMAHLKKDFLGQSELLYYHAQLIVLIRREANIKQNFARFKALWESETDFLLAQLNMRWLASAIDTFIDHDNNETDKALYLASIMFINTIKLYETENYLLGFDEVDEHKYSNERFEKTQANCFDLFDQLPSFRVGVDDTLRNMRWRMNKTGDINSLAHKILINVFDRMNNNGSVYTRFRRRHTKIRNNWWSEGS